MPPICGMVTWLSSMKTSALSGRYSKSVGGGSPGAAPLSGRSAARLDYIETSWPKP